MAEKSFFHEIHQELDAKLVPDGKYQLPLFYPGGAVAEHRHTLAGASLFDRSGTGCFQIAGKDAGKKLDKLFFRSSSALKVGSSMSNFMLTAQKTFAAVFTLNRMQEDDFMLLLDREVPDKNGASRVCNLKGVTYVFCTYGRGTDQPGRALLRHLFPSAQ